MLFIVMHKATEATENMKPDQTIISSMGRLIGEAQANGTFYNAAGLMPSKHRVRLTLQGGKVTRTDGITPDQNELVKGFTMLKVRSMDEAVEWATRLAQAAGDATIDVGPVVQPWDLGLMAKPANAPLQVLATPRADANSEAGTPASPATKANLAALVESMKDAGVFLAQESLGPTSRGTRLRTSRGKHTWTDGPFAESKELIAGFTILKLGSLAEAKAWADRYADILGDIEVDVREVVTDAP